MRIKIYDKTFTLLTTLINGSSSSDFNNLQYKNKVNDIGDASFDVRVDNSKINTANLLHYNKIEVTDDDGTVRWTGLIVEKNISLNLINVKCYGLGYILNKRLIGASETYNGQADTAITTLLANANAVEATGIIAGAISLATAVNLTFKRSKSWQAMKSVLDGADGQIVINNDRSLDFKTVVGTDLTASVIFRYERASPELANILKFNVNDGGRDIISKTYGESGAFTSNQENATIKNLYGLLEEYVNFRELNDQVTLDNSSINNNKDSQLSPSIQLSPDTTDNFEAGDIIAIKLDNDFVQLDGNYQIMEKAVSVASNQKLIVIKINDEIGTFTDDFKKLKNNLDLLNAQV